MMSDRHLFNLTICGLNVSISIHKGGITMETLLYSLRPEVIISLGISSLLSGTMTGSTTLNPYATKEDAKSTTLSSLSSTITGSMVLAPGISYVQDLKQTEVYIQSLSKEELQDLSDMLSLINDEDVQVEENEELMDYLRTLSLGEFKESYEEIEQKVKSRTWG